MIFIQYRVWNTIIQPVIWKETKFVGKDAIDEYLNCKHRFTHNRLSKLSTSIDPDCGIIIEFNNLEDETFFRLKWGLK